MGSYAEVKVGETALFWSKSCVPDDIRSLFREEERICTEITDSGLDGEDECQEIIYRIRRATALARLHTMGYTKKFCERVLDEKQEAEERSWERIEWKDEWERVQLDWRKTIGAWRKKGTKGMEGKYGTVWEYLDRLPALVVLSPDFSPRGLNEAVSCAINVV